MLLTLDHEQRALVKNVNRGVNIERILRANTLIQNSRPL